jgi:hypothetical protein
MSDIESKIVGGDVPLFVERDREVRACADHSKKQWKVFLKF